MFKSAYRLSGCQVVRLSALVFLFCGVVVQGESRLLFPTLPLAPTTFMGVVFVNTSNQDATLTLTAYDAAGALVAGNGFNNPTEVVVSSGQQVGPLARAIFCTGRDCSGVDPTTVAWFEARTPVDDVTGFFFTLNSSVTAFDGADLPEPSPSLLFPEVRIDGDFSTELNIVNPNPAAAAVTLRLLGGAVEQTVTANIAGMGVSRLDVGSVFNQPASAGAEATALYIIAESNLSIAGFEIVRAGGGDFIATSAKSAQEVLNTLFFPQLVVQGGSATELVVNNLDNQAVILTITAFQANGTPYGPQQLTTNPVQVALGPGEVLREDLEGFFGFLAGSQLLQGWIKVESTSESINGSLSYEFPGVGSRAAVASQALGRKEAIFSHIATTQGFFTGVAILNASSLVANVRVVAIARDGTVLGTYSTVLQPGERSSRTLSVIIPEAANQDGGTVWFTSDVPVFVTALFGRFTTPTVGVLANIPPQSVPESYQPDQGIERLTVSPDLAVLETGQNQVFSVMGNSESPIWKVNDIEGGNALVGTISDTGFYQAPALLPMGLPVGVTADAGNQVAGASVDVLTRQELVTNLGIVQSVAYLSGLQRLYTAELSVLVAGASAPAGSINSSIFDVTSGSQQTVVSLPGEEISKMVPFLGIDGNEYLLLAARTSGKIIRLNPLTGQRRDVATGLSSPSAIVLDPNTSDLLVAESDQLTRIPTGLLNAGFIAAQEKGRFRPTGLGFLNVSGDGIAVDRCTGRIYISFTSLGAIDVYDPMSGMLELVVSGSSNPGQLLGFHRNGLTCPESFHLLVAGGDRISLVLPQEGRVLPWVQAPGIRDLALLPEAPNGLGSAGSDVLPESQGVFSGEVVSESGTVAFTPTLDAYQGDSINPPMLPAPPPCPITQITNTIGQGSFLPTISADGTRISFTSSGNFTDQNLDGNLEIFIYDLIGPSSLGAPSGNGNFRQITTTPAGVASLGSDLSDNGSILAFASNANIFSLNPPEPGGPVAAIYRYDLESADLALVDHVQAIFTPPIQLFELTPSIDGSGRYIGYLGNDRNLWLYDHQGSPVQITTRQSFWPQLSSDSSTVAFSSAEDIQGFNPDFDGVFWIYNRSTGQISRVVVETPRTSAGQTVLLFEPGLVLDADASKGLLVSAANLTGSNPGNLRQAYLYSASGLAGVSGSVSQISQLDRSVGIVDTAGGDISLDGSIVTYTSIQDPLGQNSDRNFELFRYDATRDSLVQLTRSVGGIPVFSRISGDGRLIVLATNLDLTGNNSDGNGEIFLADCSALN